MNSNTGNRKRNVLCCVISASHVVWDVDHPSGHVPQEPVVEVYLPVASVLLCNRPNSEESVRETNTGHHPQVILNLLPISSLFVIILNKIQSYFVY